MLRLQLESSQEQQPFDRIYGIGDNPPVDIRGANNAKHWSSILVETGVHVAGQSISDERDVPDILVPDIGEAVDCILSSVSPSTTTTTTNQKTCP